MKLSLDQAYEILGLDTNADEPTVKKAYYALAKRWHPDKAKECDKAKCEEEMKLINVAYKRIMNPDADDEYEYEEEVEFFNLSVLFSMIFGDAVGFGFSMEDPIYDDPEFFRQYEQRRKYTSYSSRKEQQNQAQADIAKKMKKQQPSVNPQFKQRIMNQISQLARPVLEEKTENSLVVNIDKKKKLQKIDDHVRWELIYWCEQQGVNSKKSLFGNSDETSVYINALEADTKYSVQCRAGYVENGQVLEWGEYSIESNFQTLPVKAAKSVPATSAPTPTSKSTPKEQSEQKNKIPKKQNSFVETKEQQVDPEENKDKSNSKNQNNDSTDHSLGNLESNLLNVYGVSKDSSSAAEDGTDQKSNSKNINKSKTRRGTRAGRRVRRKSQQNEAAGEDEEEDQGEGEEEDDEVAKQKRKEEEKRQKELEKILAREEKEIRRAGSSAKRSQAKIVSKINKEVESRKEKVAANEKKLKEKLRPKEPFVRQKVPVFTDSDDSWNQIYNPRTGAYNLLQPSGLPYSSSGNNALRTGANPTSAPSSSGNTRAAGQTNAVPVRINSNRQNAIPSNTAPGGSFFLGSVAGTSICPHKFSETSSMAEDNSGDEDLYVPAENPFRALEKEESFDDMGFVAVGHNGSGHKPSSAVPRDNQVRNNSQAAAAAAATASPTSATQTQDAIQDNGDLPDWVLQMSEQQFKEEEERRKHWDEQQRQEQLELERALRESSQLYELLKVPDIPSKPKPNPKPVDMSQFLHLSSQVSSEMPPESQILDSSPSGPVLTLEPSDQVISNSHSFADKDPFGLWGNGNQQHGLISQKNEGIARNTSAPLQSNTLYQNPPGFDTFFNNTNASGISTSNMNNSNQIFSNNSSSKKVDYGWNKYKDDNRRIEQINVASNQPNPDFDEDADEDVEQNKDYKKIPPPAKTPQKTKSPNPSFPGPPPGFETQGGNIPTSKNNQNTQPLNTHTSRAAWSGQLKNTQNQSNSQQIPGQWGADIIDKKLPGNFQTSHTTAPAPAPTLTFTPAVGAWGANFVNTQQKPQQLSNNAWVKKPLAQGNQSQKINSGHKNSGSGTVSGSWGADFVEQEKQDNVNSQWGSSTAFGSRANSRGRGRNDSWERKNVDSDKGWRQDNSWSRGGLSNRGGGRGGGSEEKPWRRSLDGDNQSGQPSQFWAHGQGSSQVDNWRRKKEDSSQGFSGNAKYKNESGNRGIQNLNSKAPQNQSDEWKSDDDDDDNDQIKSNLNTSQSGSRGLIVPENQRVTPQFEIGGQIAIEDSSDGWSSTSEEDNSEVQDNTKIPQKNINGTGIGNFSHQQGLVVEQNQQNTKDQQQDQAQQIFVGQDCTKQQLNFEGQQGRVDIASNKVSQRDVQEASIDVDIGSLDLDLENAEVDREKFEDLVNLLLG